MVAQAFQPVQAQVEACGCRKPPFDGNSALDPYFLMSEGRG